MKLRALLVATAAAAVAIPVAVASGGAAVDRATGGGQVLLNPTDPLSGETIAFTARNVAATGRAARGQIQVNDHTGGVKFHGTVDCLAVTGAKSMGQAYMSGTVERSSGTQPMGPRFRLYVTDGGTGQDERGNDVIDLKPAQTGSASGDQASATCGFEGDPNTDNRLYHGNTQVYDNASQQSASSKSSRSKRLSTRRARTR